MIDETGKNLGVMETSQAIRLAGERGLDLIEIAPGVNPPVCKIIDFGKFKYERERGEREHSKKQKHTEIKSIRIGFTTSTHDLEVRAAQAEKFLAAGNNVRVQMRLFGREKSHGVLAMEKFNEFLAMIPGEHGLEHPPKRFPQGIIVVITKSKDERQTTRAGQ